jgi:serine/threonine protein phosphatase PrpC
MDQAIRGQDPFLRKLVEFLTPQFMPRSAAGFGSVWLGTNLGNVRKDNQDRVVVVRVSYDRRPQDNFTLAVLADGVGGLANGADAAVITISSFVANSIRNVRLPHPERLVGAAQFANALLYDTFGGRSGSTLSAVFVNSSACWGVNVGDSRIFGVDPESRITQLSEDDTLENYVKFSESVREGRNALVQYIGMGEGVEPHVIAVDGKRYSKLLLTSDGIHGIGSGIFGQIVRSSSSSQELVRKLLTLNDISGGTDNGSVISIPPTLSEAEDATDGASVKVFSPSDRLEIWIPANQFQEKSTNWPASDAKYDALKEQYDALLERVQKQKKKPTKPRVSRASKAGSEETSPPLPLEDEKPEVNISFPNKRE